MVQRAGDLALAQMRAIVALDKQRDAAAVIDEARPRERGVEGVELLVQEPILLQRSDGLRSARAAIGSIRHTGRPVVIVSRKNSADAMPFPRNSRINATSRSHSCNDFARR